MQDESTKPSHTPAPWFDDGYRIHAPTEDSDKRNGRVIVEYKHVDGFNDADAPLIEKAPIFYDLLTRCLPYIKSASYSDNPGYEDDNPPLYEAMKEALGVA